MSKYIPAILVHDHFGKLKYEFGFSGEEAATDYQTALTRATELARQKKAEKPITRSDGLEFNDKRVTPVVLKRVEMVEQL